MNNLLGLCFYFGANLHKRKHLWLIKKSKVLLQPLNARHCVLESSHPSPLGAKFGFTTCSNKIYEK